jgi:hypothetical protein
MRLPSAWLWVWTRDAYSIYQGIQRPWTSRPLPAVRVGSRDDGLLGLGEGHRKVSDHDDSVGPKTLAQRQLLRGNVPDLIPHDRGEGNGQSGVERGRILM